MIRFGIVGCGNISGTHAEALQKIQEAQLTACCDIDEEKGRRFGEKHGCSFYGNYLDMLKNGEIDAVIIATPHYLHGQMTLQAFEAGKHVLCEKPMAITVQEAEQVLAKWAERPDLHYAVCYQNRFNPSYAQLKTMIAQQAFGQLKGIKCELTWHRDKGYYEAASWKGTWKKEGGGTLINQAIHTLDVVTWMIELPEKIKGKIMTTLLEETIEVEDAAMATAVLPDDVPVVIHASNNYSSDPAPSVTFDFEEARVVLTADKLVVNDVAAPLEEGMVSEVAKAYWGGGHLRFVRAFVNQLVGLPDSYAEYLAAADALDSLKMVCGIYESDRSGQWVQLNK